MKVDCVVQPMPPYAAEQPEPSNGPALVGAKSTPKSNPAKVGEKYPTW